MTDKSDDATYAPFVTGSDTSEAAAGNPARKARQRRAVMSAIRDAGERGLTDDEGEVALRLPHQAYSARRRGLVLEGLVEDSGRRRRTRHGRSAAVWIDRLTRHGARESQ